MVAKYKVLLPRQVHPAGPGEIDDIAEFKSVADYGTSSEDLVPVIGKFDAIILRSAQLTEEVIEAANRLKVISKHGVGLDNVDIETASENGVVVCNTPGVNSRTVAEGAITHLLTVRRNIVEADAEVRAGNWEERANWDRFSRHTIEGEMLGLFGFGNIARNVANMAVGLGMECVTYDPYIPDDAIPSSVERVSEKSELFEAADAVSVHTPLTDETHHAIGWDELSEIDYIINTARGGVINEAELIEALDSESLISAGLDVLEQEPPNGDNPLLSRDDVILTPHFGGLSLESSYLMSTNAATNVRTVHEGGIPESTVNKNSISE